MLLLLFLFFVLLCCFVVCCVASRPGATPGRAPTSREVGVSAGCGLQDANFLGGLALIGKMLLTSNIRYPQPKQKQLCGGGSFEFAPQAQHWSHVLELRGFTPFCGFCSPPPLLVSLFFVWANLFKGEPTGGGRPFLPRVEPPTALVALVRPPGLNMKKFDALTGRIA